MYSLTKLNILNVEKKILTLKNPYIYLSHPQSSVTAITLFHSLLLNLFLLLLSYNQSSEWAAFFLLWFPLLHFLLIIIIFFLIVPRTCEIDVCPNDGNLLAAASRDDRIKISHRWYKELVKSAKSFYLIQVKHLNLFSK